MMTRKLKRKNGASLVMAMLAFLVVTMVSLVIVSAAITNAKRIEKEREYEQTYLLAQSIAEVLRDSIQTTAAGETDRFVRITTDLDTGDVEAVMAPGSTGFDEGLETALETVCERRQSQLLALESTGDDVGGTAETATVDETAIDASSLIKIYPKDMPGKVPASVISQISATEIYAYMGKSVVSSGDYFDLTLRIRVPFDGDAPVSYYSTSLKFTGKYSTTPDVSGTESSFSVWWTDSIISVQ